MRYAGDVENGIIISQRIIAGVVAERSFAAQFVSRNVTFQNNFCGRRNFQINGLALGQLNGFFPKEAGENHFINVAGEWRSRGISNNRVGSDCHCRLDFICAEIFCVTEIFRAVLMNMPMHTRCPRVIFLQAIHSDVAFTRRRIFGEDERQGYKSSAVIGPAFKDRDFIKRRIDFDDLLARRVLDVFWKVNRAVCSGQDRQDVGTIFKRQVRQFHNFANIVSRVVQLFNAQRKSHALITSERIHQHGHIVAANFFKQQGDVAPVLEL